MMKASASALMLLLLSGCSTPSDSPAQQAQKGKVGPAHSLSMEQLCRQNAARRYNTDTRQIAVIGFEQFQSSYEMRGFTPRKEAFVCTFDTEGRFLHLSMR
nr:YsaB family lipoprotein [Phytobacter massiliensis]